MNCVIDSPIGHIGLERNSAGIRFVYLTDAPLLETDDELLSDAAHQLVEYFAGRRRDFDLPLVPASTVFQEKVRQAMLSIPYGTTATYGNLAKMIGCPRGSRAVGQACHNNPLLIIVPCHRVVAANGQPGGFACGLAIKEQLQNIEKQTTID